MRFIIAFCLRLRRFCHRWNGHRCCCRNGMMIPLNLVLMVVPKAMQMAAKKQKIPLIGLLLELVMALPLLRILLADRLKVL